MQRTGAPNRIPWISITSRSMFSTVTFLYVCRDPERRGARIISPRRCSVFGRPAEVFVGSSARDEEFSFSILIPIPETQTQEHRASLIMPCQKTFFLTYPTISQYRRVIVGVSQTRYREYVGRFAKTFADLENFVFVLEKRVQYSAAAVFRIL